MWRNSHLIIIKDFEADERFLLISNLNIHHLELKSGNAAGYCFYCFVLLAAAALYCACRWMVIWEVGAHTIEIVYNRKCVENPSNYNFQNGTDC